MSQIVLNNLHFDLSFHIVLRTLLHAQLIRRIYTVLEDYGINLPYSEER